MIRIASFIVLTVILTLSASGQYENYGMYRFTEMRVSPAYLATGTDAAISLLYRDQRSLPGVQFNSSYLNAKYPFLRKKGPWSGIGLEMSNGNEGVNGMLKSNSIGVGYALNTPVKKKMNFSFGVSVDYFQRKITSEGLLTGSQYVVDMGFDPGLDPGENLARFNSQNMSVNLGVRWQGNDKKGRERDHFGVSAYNVFSTPERFIGKEDSRLPVALMAEGAKRVYETKKWKADMEMLVRYENAPLVWSVGGVGTVNLRYVRNNLKGQSLGVLLKYTQYNGILTGVTWDTPGFSLGASYGVPLEKTSAINDIFEVGLRLKKPVKAKRGRHQSAYVPPRRPRSTTPTTTETEVITDHDSETDSLNTIPVQPPLDTAKTYVLYFEFDFGSATPILGNEVRSFLDQIVNKLRENPSLTVLIVGHTDDVGSRSYNQKLSEERAFSIYRLLVEKGVDPFQLAYMGRGESHPLVENVDEESRAKNRRVEIQLISEE